jgi:hypothetical protein
MFVNLEKNLLRDVGHVGIVHAYAAEDSQDRREVCCIKGGKCVIGMLGCGAAKKKTHDDYTRRVGESAQQIDRGIKKSFIWRQKRQKRR